MQYSTLMEVKSKKLVLADEMGAAFMSSSTFLQLHGFTVCFTDMSNIVENCVVELPFSLVMAHAFSAMRLHGYTPEQVAKLGPRRLPSSDMYNIYLSLVTSELMDSKQAEYYSDYCLHGVEEVSRQDFESKSASPPDSGELWYYHMHGDARLRYRLKLTEVNLPKIYAKQINE